MAPQFPVRYIIDFSFTITCIFKALIAFFSVFSVLAEIQSSPPSVTPRTLEFYIEANTSTITLIGCISWARGYKTFFVLNSAEHEILNAHKYENIKKFSIFLYQISLQYYFPAKNVKMPF